MTKLIYTGQLEDVYCFESKNKNWIVDIYKEMYLEKNMIIQGDIDNFKRKFYFTVDVNSKIILYVRNPWDSLSYLRSYSSVRGEKMPIPNYLENEIINIAENLINNINYLEELNKK